MAAARVNYDQIASTYDQRYTVSQFAGIATALRSLVQDVDAERVLEVGCGTGRWLAELQPVTRQVYGIDLSLGMLQQARQRLQSLSLICGHASRLPFPDAGFDLIFCVNAFHHFPQPRVFISEARRLLRPGGALAITGMDPHAGRDRWYLYDYFVGTQDTDLRRFSSSGTILDWMVAAGFERVEWRVVEHIMGQHIGQAVLEDPILQKHGTSQLALLTDEAYAAGMARIKSALSETEATGRTPVFPVDISLTIVTGRVQ
ncbi:MAG TPA: methyltransferase domain-containing protein [Candidatus Binatia bacterium]|jgi:SAM-dependent methyltransferase|nr:methyltransferase domain-containing protein [Candidatus Binatia bacterium]